MLNLKFVLIFVFIVICSCKENRIEKQELLSENFDYKAVLEQDSVKVIHIADGDSFTVLYKEQSYKIRIHGIDAPEKTMPFYKTSKSFLASLIFNQYVYLKINTKDQYYRYIADVSLTNQTNIAYEMVKNGMAWHYLKYSNDSNSEQFQVEAQKNKLGIWYDTQPIPPWEFRKSKRDKRFN